MPPFQEEFEPTMMIATPAPAAAAAALTHSPSSHTNLLELPKDVAFLDLITQQVPDVAAVNGDDDDDIILRDRLEFSLQRAIDRAAEIKARMTDTTNDSTTSEFQAKSPLIFEACQSALLGEMARKLNQAALLLEDTKREDNTKAEGVTQMTKNKRLSSALISSLQYLDTIESAMSYSSRDRLEASLRSVVHSIAGDNTDLYDKNASTAVCVSSWRAPSLAFDFCVGSPAVHHSVGSSSSLPIDLKVKPIVEYTADELILQYDKDDAPLRKSQPRDAGFYAVKVKKCLHEKKKNVPREGMVGQAMVQVHIAPLADTNSKKKEAVWGMDTKDVLPMRIKEVRA